MLKTIKKIDIRILSAIALILIVVPILIMNYYLTTKAGKIIGSVFYMIVGIWGTFEIIRSFGFNRFNALLTSSTIILFFLIGFEEYKLITDFNVHPRVGSASLKSLLLKGFDWKPYSLILLTSLIPLVLEPKVLKKSFNLLKGQILVTLVIIISFTFFKGLWIINVYRLEYAILLILAAVFSDTFSFFGGRYFGEKLFKGAKLAKNISPNKTWAGFVIGFVFSFVYLFITGILTNIWIDLDINKYLFSFLSALLFSVVSPIGDLFFSYVKRQINIKDFSSLIPQHGGIFDRLDSLSFVITFVVLIFIII